jgi:protein-serine/threonine kinase
MQIVPSSSNGLDAVNFRHLKESNSLHLEDQIQGVAGPRYAPGTPGLTADDGLDIPADGVDLFGAFNSVTLHYDGES